MQDIDFDELDRAVSSVMTTPDDSTPVDTPQPVAETPVAPAPTSASPAVRRSSGRFMDVVHPSSDMRSASQSSRPKAPESTPGVTPAPQPVVETPEPKSDSFSWPDPIDMAAAKMPDQPEPAVETPAEPDATPSHTDDTPLESPFLTDTKVEKRPLGAFSETPAPLDLSAALDEISNETSEAVENTEVMENTSPSSAPLSVHDVDENALELSEEALIGASENSDTSPVETTAPAPVPLSPVKTPEGPATDLEPTVPLGAASIPQQYAEQPTSNDQPSGAIYDTEAYHQPLNHPHKKGNGWLVVIWIVGLIVLGGGLGAALYFFVLPQL